MENQDLQPHPPSLVVYHQVYSLSIPHQKNKKKGCRAAREEVFDEMLEFDSKNRIISFKDINLASCTSLLPCIDDLSLFHPNQMINFQSNSFVHDTGIPKHLLRFKQNFSYESFHYGVKCSFVSLHANKIFRITRWSLLTEALRF